MEELQRSLGIESMEDVERIHSLAESGYAQAQMKMGFMYSQGICISSNGTGSYVLFF